MRVLKVLAVIGLFFGFAFANEVGNDVATQMTQTPQIDLSIESLYSHAHFVVKGVIWILIVFSFFSWAIFIYKLIAYKSSMNKLKNDEEALKNGDFKSVQFSDLGNALYEEVKDELSKSKNKDEALRARLEQRLKLRLDALISDFKKGISFLASVGSSSPFIGLFGTVWGIMHSFINIANAQNPSLTVVAPGIAEALFATALGLVVAIPAVLFYNYLVKLIGYFSHQLDEVATRLYTQCDRELSHKE